MSSTDSASRRELIFILRRRDPFEESLKGNRSRGHVDLTSDHLKAKVAAQLEVDRFIVFLLSCALALLRLHHGLKTVLTNRALTAEQSHGHLISAALFVV